MLGWFRRGRLIIIWRTHHHATAPAIVVHETARVNTIHLMKYRGEVGLRYCKVSSVRKIKTLLVYETARVNTIHLMKYRGGVKIGWSVVGRGY